MRVTAIMALTVVFMSPLSAQEKAAEKTNSAAGREVCVVYKGLATGALVHAMLKELPDKIILRTESVTITEEELGQELAAAPDHLQDELAQNAFFVVEQIAARKLLIFLARREAKKSGTDVSGYDERKLIQRTLEPARKGVKVTTAEIAGFYRDNRRSLGGASLEDVRKQIEYYLRDRKEKEAVVSYLQGLGKQLPIEISAKWLKKYAATARNNPLDKHRWNGKSTLVAFSGASCCGPDGLKAVLETITKKYGKALNVVYLEARGWQILAARYNVNSIPTLILFDQAGSEVFRKNGALTGKEIERELGKIGITP